MRFLIVRRAFLALLILFSLHCGAVPVGVKDGIPVWRYTVKPGDNLINIAERYLARAEQWPVVQQANRISNPYRLLPGTILRIPGVMLRMVPAQAVLESLNGLVRWRIGEAAWQEAKQGQQLSSGASLETLDNASALLILADGSKIIVSPNSLITLDTLSRYADGLMADTRMRLQHGQANIMANPLQRTHQNLRIQTPSAQAVVRGTHFRLGVGEDVTREETLGGLVSIGGAGSVVNVPKGLGTITRKGERPMKPVALLGSADVSGLPTRIERLPMRFPLPGFGGASEWQGEIASDDSFERILLSKSARGDALTFADLPNGDYVLRLRAVDVHGIQGLDALHPFTVFARPFPPGLNAPGDSATIRSARPLLDWGNVLEVARYRIQISSASDFSRLLHDETLERESWQVHEDLPEGKLYWRAASVTVDGQQGPWSVATSFSYKPGPGAAELGRAALHIDSEMLKLVLPPPPDGLFYEAILSTEKEMAPVLTQAKSDSGALDLPRPGTGIYYLGVRLVDQSDNTPGPITIQRIEIPHSRWWLLLLLIPLAL